MPEEQNPDPPLPEPEVSQEPPKDPTAQFGWYVSGALFLVLIVAAVAGYVNQEPGERSFKALQDTLHYSVSLKNIDLPALSEKLDETVDEEIQGTLKSALRDAAEHEEAARVALAAGYELGEQPDETALQTLEESDDELSQLIAALYGGSVVTQESVDELRGHESQEFAVQLAQVHAMEMLDEDGGRATVAPAGYALARIAVAGVLFVVIAAGFVALVLFFVNLKSGRWKPAGFMGQVVPADADRYMMRFAFCLASLMAIPYLISPVMKRSGIDSSWQTLIVMAGLTVFVLATLGRPVLGKADGIRRLVGEKRGFMRLVGVGVFGYLTTVPVFVLVLLGADWLSKYLPAPTHPLEQELVGLSGFGWLPIIVTTAIIVPILEETIFRGLLFPAIAAKIGKPIVAVFASAFLFAAIHPQGPLIWPALMATGGAAAYLRYHTGSLIPSYTLHMVHNGAIVAVSMLVG